MPPNGWYRVNEIYKKFLLKYPQIKISKISFFGLKPLNCTKPKSNQDVCPICKDKKHLNRIKGKIKDNRYLDYKKELKI